MKNDYPQIVGHYVHATKKIYNVDIWVPTLDFSKFRVLEDDLREIGASSKDYAYTVLSVLSKWTEDHKMNHVPVNVFCGKFAFNKFLKVWKSETVEIKDDPMEELLYSERLVAEKFIADNVANDGTISFGDVVEQLEPLLSARWLELYNAKKYRPSMGMVLDEMCEKYRLSYAKDYMSLVCKVMKIDTSWVHNA